MLRPDFVLVLSGGNAGQVLSKNSNVDGDYVWSTPSSGGTPGGSDTHIQFNDSGAFAGNDDFVYNKTAKTLTMNSGYPTYSPWILLDGANKKIEVDGGASGSGAVSAANVHCQSLGAASFPFYVTPYITIENTGLGPVIRLADYDWIAFNGTGVLIDDPTRVVKIGNPYNTPSTLLTVDCAGEIVTSNVDIECTTVGDGFILKSPDGTRWRIAVSNLGVVTAGAA